MNPTSSTEGQTQKVAPTHDFSAKLRQPALLPRVTDYVAWQRELRAARERGEEGPVFPDWSPLSINLDLTTACNYRCDHCIDWDILNTPIRYDFDKLLSSLDHMAKRGLKSVILIGGGEPTTFPGFGETVRFLKERDVQVAIVSNGSRNQVILDIMDVLDERDWVRLSLDSGSNETFRAMHRPVKDISLDEICSWIPKLRAKNPKPLVGFSYIIVWEGAEREEGVNIVPNIDEIVMATKRARDSGFSYISLKPFLTRRETGAEVMDPESADQELDQIVARIRAQVDEAKTYATADFRVVESINLMVLEEGRWKEFTHQPRTCHMQHFRQVLSPLGLYNCPAHRGVEKAQIGTKHAYADEASFHAAAQSTGRILETFDASRECAEVTCLYHSVNWWIEKAIQNPDDGTLLAEAVERFDYFL